MFGIYELPAFAVQTRVDWGVSVGDVNTPNEYVYYAHICGTSYSGAFDSAFAGGANDVLDITPDTGLGCFVTVIPPPNGSDIRNFDVYIMPASCYEVWVNGANVSHQTPAYGNGYEPYGPTADSESYSFLAEIRTTTNVMPIAVWDAKDQSGGPSGAAPQNGQYQLSADGMSEANATVINTDTSAYPVTFAFEGPSLGCTLCNSVSGDGATLTAGTNQGTVHIVARTSDPDAFCLAKDFYFNVCSCQGCQDCPGQYGLHSVDLKFSLGPSRLGANKAFRNLCETRY
jgi:hypothetical protein